MTTSRLGVPMFATFGDFLAALTHAEWEDDGHARDVSVDALCRLGSARDVVVSQIMEWHHSGLTEVAEQSHETSTHYKWFVFRDPERRFTIWLHQYKPASRRRTGHATTAHNHRYGFSSLVLVGGFTQIEYEQSTKDVPPQETKRLDLRAGDVFSVEPAEIHRMDDILDPTMTLIVERRPAHHHSVVYDLASGAETEYPDFIGQYEALVEDARLIAPT